MKAFIPLFLVSTLASSVAFAHQEGDILVRGGIISVMPNESSDKYMGYELEIGDDTQLGFSATYMFSDNLGVEVLGATPFTHEVKLAGDKVAEVSQLPPSVVAEYYFGNAESKVRPYVGAGLNYTVFFDEEGYGALDGTDVSLDNSFGLAVVAGVDVDIKDNWFATASVWYMDINTDVDTAVGTLNTDIDPIAVMLGVGYSF